MIPSIRMNESGKSSWTHQCPCAMRFRSSEALLSWRAAFENRPATDSPNRSSIAFFTTVSLVRMATTGLRIDAATAGSAPDAIAKMKHRSSSISFHAPRVATIAKQRSGRSRRRRASAWMFRVPSIFRGFGACTLTPDGVAPSSGGPGQGATNARPGSHFLRDDSPKFAEAA